MRHIFEAIISVLGVFGWPILILLGLLLFAVVLGLAFLPLTLLITGISIVKDEKEYLIGFTFIVISFLLFVGIYIAYNKGWIDGLISIL